MKFENWKNEVEKTKLEKRNFFSSLEAAIKEMG